MTNERFYPATERKNDYVIKNVQQVQLDNKIQNCTKTKRVLDYKKLKGVRAYEVTDEFGYRTILENIFEN